MIVVFLLVTRILNYSFVLVNLQAARVAEATDYPVAFII
jgi:hypothetical protein